MSSSHRPIFEFSPIASRATTSQRFVPQLLVREVALTKPRGPAPRQGQVPTHEFGEEWGIVSLEAKEIKGNKMLVLYSLSSRIAPDLRPFPDILPHGRVTYLLALQAGP